MKRYELQAGERDEGVSLLYFLRRAFPLAPGWQLQKSLKARDIRVNGQRVSDNRVLQAGDQLVWYTAWQPEDLQVVYEDSHVLLINKPAGLNSDSQVDGPSMSAWAQVRGESKRAVLVHRLDNRTSGIMVLAKSQQAEQALLAAFRQGKVHKRYECLVVGKPQPETARLKAWLRKLPGQARVRLYDRPQQGAREVVTDYRLLQAEEGFSRLQVMPLTGRTHQIRAQLSHIGHPILGDELYGDFAANKRWRAGRLMLAATGLRFELSGGMSYLNDQDFYVEAAF